MNWKPTGEYRWFRRVNTYVCIKDGPQHFCGQYPGGGTVYTPPVLQQHWVNDSGVVQWRDVETVHETMADAEARVAAYNKERAKP